MITTAEKVKCRPFLKWAGGKGQILKELIRLLPKDIDQRVYREPFLGGGALFFATRPKTAILSDANEHLIRCFEYVRDNPELVADYLLGHRRENCESYYYDIRDLYNKSGYSAAQAARFIYMNKACYNGIFRVNKSGGFNVPYGKRDPLGIPSRDHLRKVSEILKSARLFTADFQEALQNVNEGDFVYLDPPYPPLNGTSNFTSYTADKFGNEDQEEVAQIVKKLDAKGCLFMVSNANTETIRRLYKEYNKVKLRVTRYITCKKVKHKVKEVVITNYEVK